MFIREVNPRIIKNSRGEKTIQIDLVTYEGRFFASAPGGKSRGIHEVLPYHKDGIEASMKRLKVFCKKLIGKNFFIKKVSDLDQIEDLVKSFESKYGRLGGNITYALDTVILKAAAKTSKKELWQFINDDVNKGKKPKMPMPVGNCIGGGKHSGLIKGKKPDFQEFLLIPKEKTFSHAVTVNLRAYGLAQKLLRSFKRNDENAWMTNKSNEEVLEILNAVAKKYKLRIGLDVAASSFFEKGYYKYKNKELIRDKVDQADYIEKIIRKYKLFYIEDPMDEEDFSRFKEILASTKEKKRKVLIVGDDLTTTHIKDVRRAAKSKSMDAMIVKPNQVGSLLEVKKVVEFCKKNDIIMIFSHRSGETMDDALADYCVGFGGQFMKAGIYGRERLIKLKRVMDIERSLR